VRACCPPLGPVSSCHDRACELFYALKGGRVDYGEAHAAAHAHRRYGGVREAFHAGWSAEEPVVLVTHSQGATTARALLRLLHASAFEGHATSANWVRGVVCICAPFNGAPLLTSPAFGGVPLPVLRTAARDAPGPLSARIAREGAAAASELQQPVGRQVVWLLITLGYVAEVLLGWCACFRRVVWDWRLEQWALGLADLPALLRSTHRLQCSGDTALLEITPTGAAYINATSTMYEGVYYVSLPCQVTEGEHALPVPTCSPLHVILAAVGAWCAKQPSHRHSDGLLPTSSQMYPQDQPHMYVRELSPPLGTPPSPLRAEEEYAAQRHAVARALRDATWCHADPCALSHTEASLQPESRLLEYVLCVVVPAVCDAAHARTVKSE